MTAVKQAFANLRADIKDGVVWWAGRGVDLDTIEAALRESQTREREMFKALSRVCPYQYRGFRCTRPDIGKCTRRNCPLLKPAVKPCKKCSGTGRVWGGYDFFGHIQLPCPVCRHEKWKTGFMYAARKGKKL